jgi:hypothetical protein
MKLRISPALIMLTYEGKQGVLDAISYLKNQAPLRPLQKNDYLCVLAQEAAHMAGA